MSSSTTQESSPQCSASVPQDANNNVCPSSDGSQPSTPPPSRSGSDASSLSSHSTVLNEFDATSVDSFSANSHSVSLDSVETSGSDTDTDPYTDLEFQWKRLGDVPKDKSVVKEEVQNPSENQVDSFEQTKEETTENGLDNEKEDKEEDKEEEEEENENDSDENDGDDERELTEDESEEEEEEYTQCSNVYVVQCQNEGLPPFLSFMLYLFLFLHLVHYLVLLLDSRDATRKSYNRY